MTIIMSLPLYGVESLRRTGTKEQWLEAGRVAVDSFYIDVMHREGTTYVFEMTPTFYPLPDDFFMGVFERLIEKFGVSVLDAYSFRLGIDRRVPDGQFGYTSFKNKTQRGYLMTNKENPSVPKETESSKD